MQTDLKPTDFYDRHCPWPMCTWTVKVLSQAPSSLAISDDARRLHLEAEHGGELPGFDEALRMGHGLFGVRVGSPSTE